MFKMFNVLYLCPDDLEIYFIRGVGRTFACMSLTVFTRLLVLALCGCVRRLQTSFLSALEHLTICPHADSMLTYI
jgi:hypothetical protein